MLRILQDGLTISSLACQTQGSSFGGLIILELRPECLPELRPVASGLPKPGIIAEYENGGFVEPKSITVSQYLSKWLETVINSVSPKTFERYHGICLNHFIPALGAVKLQDLTALQIQSSYNWFLKSGRKDGGGGLSKRTVVHHHRVLKTALSQAVNWQLISKNPCDKVKVPKPDKAKIEFLDKPEIATLLKSAEGTRLYPVIVLAVTTGMRRGEILALRRSDLDLEAGVVHVARTMEHTTAHGIRFKEPKSVAGRRTISLPRIAVDILRRYLVERSRLMLRSGIGRSETDLVFTTIQGKPRKLRALTQEFGRFIKTVDITQITFHGMRHSHITQLLMNNVPINVVSERAGHASVSTTLDLYGHVIPSAQQGVADLVDRELNKALGEQLVN